MMDLQDCFVDCPRNELVGCLGVCLNAFEAACNEDSYNECIGNCYQNF